MSLKPLQPKRTIEESGFPTGSLVMYENEGSPYIGAILGFKKSRYAVFNMRGREIELQPNRLHRLPGSIPITISKIDERTKFLSKLFDDCTARSHEIRFGEIWETVGDASEKTYSDRELCELYFGDADLESQLSMRLGLITDKIYFRRDKEGFVPRPASVTEELKRAESNRKEKEELRRKTLFFFRDRLQSPGTPIDKELATNIELLEDFAANGDDVDHSRHKEAVELVHLLIDELKLNITGNNEQRAFALLERIGHFHKDTNLSLIRHKPPRRFTEEALKQADAIHLPEKLSDYPEAERKARLDLTTLPAITIDDVTTKDMDDALSIERVGDGFRLGIHISDVASLIPDGSALDREAKLRATSIYGTELTFNMLPETLSQDKLSLLEGKVRPCISCMFEISRNLEITHADVIPTLVRITKRYTYTEVDELLERNEEPVAILANIAAHLESRRIQNGAIKVQKREVAVVVDPDGTLRTIEVDENSPARSLIGEMMVVANTVFANFLVSHEIPAIFRGQDRPDEDLSQNLDHIPEGPARDYAERARLKRSVTAIEPIHHASLGVSAYVQATSPIRRYGDLVIQRQVLSWLLSGKPKYSADDLQRIIYELEEPLSKAGAISKETRRYWLLRYLQRVKKVGGTITGTVIRTDTKNPIVELDEVYLPVAARLQDVKPGDLVTLKIAQIDPRSDHIRLERIS